MDKHIRLLDCTLRDGGHINDGEFGENKIRNIIERLIEANIDIIEVGFLWNKRYGKDTARYYNIADVKRILPSEFGRSKISLMADFIDLDHLEMYDGMIEYVRLSFKRSRLSWALETARILMNKGYKCFINPVNCNVYSDKEYIEVLEKVNELNPYGFSIVDTFGVMRISDLSHRYYLVENNLNANIAIGLHLHENLGLAYSLAQHFIQIANPKRNIIIDGSLLGIGRIPGNLCIEQIMDYLNNEYGMDYITEPVYDAIDDYIAPIKKNIPWGYAIPYALSAKYDLHRTYAEYLLKKQRLKTKDIQRILSQVSKAEAEIFNEDYIEKLYKDYMNVEYDETKDIYNLSKWLLSYKRILIISPGETILLASSEIIKWVDDETCIISVNFIPDFIKSQFVFFTNKKRFDIVKNNLDDNHLIITSNLIEDIEKRDAIVSYNNIVYYNDEFCDDSTVMLLNLLKRIGIKRIFIAGFDGAVNGKMKFCDTFMGNRERKVDESRLIKKILDTSFFDVEIVFLTDSEYHR